MDSEGGWEDERENDGEGEEDRVAYVYFIAILPYLIC